MTSTTTARRFQLLVHSTARGDGRYAVSVEETNGRPDHNREVVRVAAARLDAAAGALADALRTSRQPTTALKSTRRTPVTLAEDAGVRLALALKVLGHVSKPGRASRLLDGISRLSDEECFYWYAHTVGADDEVTRRRRLRALRIFLATE